MSALPSLATPHPNLIPHIVAAVQTIFKYLPNQTLTYRDFQNLFPLNCALELFNAACHAYHVQHPEEVILEVDEADPTAYRLRPRFEDFFDHLFKGINTFIQNALCCCFNNNKSSTSTSTSTSKSSKPKKNNNSPENSTETKTNKESSKESRFELPEGWESVRETLEALGITLYPRWLQRLLLSLPLDQVKRNLTALQQFHRKQKRLQNPLGALRCALLDNWQPQPPKHAPEGFLEWFERKRKEGKVLASTNTPQGIVVYGRDGEPLGMWPAVVDLV